MQDTERSARDEGGHDKVASEGSGASRLGAPRRRWSDEQKAWIVQESLERGTTVAEVAVTEYQPGLGNPLVSPSMCSLRSGGIVCQSGSSTNRTPSRRASFAADTKSESPDTSTMVSA